MNDLLQRLVRTTTPDVEPVSPPDASAGSARDARVPAVVTSVLAVAIAVAGLRGTDYPAQIYWAHLFRRVGFTIWNGGWYAGHYTLGYSVLFPPVAGTFGVMVVAVASTIASVVLFRALSSAEYGAAAVPATWWFGVAMVVNLAVGRLPFALGVAFALGSLRLVQRGRPPWLAGVTAVAATLASPLAGAFLGLAAAAVTVDRLLVDQEQRRSVAGPALVAVASVGPTLAVAFAFPDPGEFPFRYGHLIGVLVCGVGLVIVVPDRHRALRIAAALGAAAAIPLFVIANPLGGNLVRLPVILGWPLLAATVWQTRRWLVWLAAIPFAVWLAMPIVASADSYGDESTTPDYYAPLVEFVTGAPGQPGRVEIPFTADHWETAYVASDVPIARGWERQVDIARNPQFYDGSLTELSYHAWVLENAVRWIAVPDAELDPAGEDEMAIIEGRPTWLRQAWADEHWVVYEVRDAELLVEGRARLVEQRPDRLVIAVDAAGNVGVRVVYTPYWTLTGTDGCVRESTDGQTVIEAHAPGTYTLEADFSLTGLIRSPSACDD